jgi:hypothetical protein
MNELTSFLSENRGLVQAVEPNRQVTIEGGAVSVTGGCIPHGPIIHREPIVYRGPISPPVQPPRPL